MRKWDEKMLCTEVFSCFLSSASISHNFNFEHFQFPSKQTDVPRCPHSILHLQKKVLLSPVVLLMHLRVRAISDINVCWFTEITF